MPDRLPSGPVRLEIRETHQLEIDTREKPRAAPLQGGTPCNDTHHRLESIKANFAWREGGDLGTEPLKGNERRLCFPQTEPPPAAIRTGRGTWRAGPIPPGRRRSVSFLWQMVSTLSITGT